MAHRIEKISELVKHEIAKIIFDEDFGAKTLVTALDARVSPDGLHANVIYSVYPTAQGDWVSRKLASSIFDIQQLLNKRLNMRPVPKIRFVWDNTEEEGQKIEEAIARVKEEE